MRTTPEARRGAAARAARTRGRRAAAGAYSAPRSTAAGVRSALREEGRASRDQELGAPVARASREAPLIVDASGIRYRAPDAEELEVLAYALPRGREVTPPTEGAYIMGGGERAAPLALILEVHADPGRRRLSGLVYVRWLEHPPMPAGRGGRMMDGGHHDQEEEGV